MEKTLVHCPKCVSYYKEQQVREWMTNGVEEEILKEYVTRVEHQVELYIQTSNKYRWALGFTSVVVHMGTSSTSKYNTN